MDIHGGSHKQRREVTKQMALNRRRKERKKKNGGGLIVDRRKSRVRRWRRALKEKNDGDALGKEGRSIVMETA